MNKYSIITGVTGFLGSSLANALVNEGEKVIGIGRTTKGFLSESILNNEKFILLNKDIKDLSAKDFEKHNIKNVFHLASIVEYAGKDFYDYVEKSINLTSKMISLAEDLNAKSLICVSTMGVAHTSSPKELLNETTPISPTTNYTLAKYVGEKLMEFASIKNSATKFISVRFPSILGRETAGGIIHTLKQDAINGVDIELYGRGESLRNIIYIDDAVDIMIKASKNLGKLNDYELFIAGSNNSISVAQIAQKLVELTKSTSKIILSDKPLKNVANDILDLSKAKNILNFNPMTVEQGLEKYIKELEL